MNMDPNAMSPWFTAPEGEYPPMNAQAPHPNGGGQSYAAAPGSSSGLSGTVGGSGYYDDEDGEDEFANEPPLLEGLMTSCFFLLLSKCFFCLLLNNVFIVLFWSYLVELGINFEHIWAKTVSVLLPTKQINEHILDDADLAGPLVFCFLFGMCLLLVRG
ncbi:unnamed protein product [Phytophthora fragariaefolia]|uniref:Unnamed protein product n=1 Tax=Phytophthora fragariaefolia TaxID=1490495 RepID=A0A9W7CTR4_9STRA|nr:unnamed protein product [Phytophthora fragariaefolia]